MRRLLQALAIVALIAASTSAASDSAIAGTWQGKMDGLPMITLTVQDNDGKLSGTVTFYRIVDDGSGPRVDGKNNSEMVNPKLEGKSFSFQIKNSNGGMDTFKMELTGKNEARMSGITTTSNGSDSPEIKLVRQ